MEKLKKTRQVTSMTHNMHQMVASITKIMDQII